MTVEQLRQQIKFLSPEEIQRLGREILAVEQYRRRNLDLSGFALEVELSSLADAPSLLRQYGVEPKPEHLTTLEGMLAALRSGAFDFLSEDEDLYTEADLRERYR